MSESELPSLSVEDFSAFFQEVHETWPFPWQERLLLRVVADGWPAVLDLPTGSGKTAALDIAVFHLALEADRGTERKAPVRIAFVVDRRLVVDDAHTRAKKIADKLIAAEPDSVSGRVAARLRRLAGDRAQPLLARQMRGGLPREDSWARTPAQPVILCSTVDQIGSRLLFRGYGISDRMKPVQAGLIGADCLILLDEAHLSEPFRQTLGWVERYKSSAWREEDAAAPWRFVTLSATPGNKDGATATFGLEEPDREHILLNRRLNAPKQARLIPLEKAKGRGTQSELENDGEPYRKAGDRLLIETFVKQAQDGLKELQKDIAAPALAVVVNRVQRARAVFDELQKQYADQAETILLIGPSRPVDRDELAKRLDPIRTGQERALEKPLVIVATQCIEAGVDIDLDGLITEAAPLDALRQRFGRLNRNGREIQCFAALIAPVPQKKGDADPVYGTAIQTTWKYLLENAEKPSGKDKISRIDFGLEAFRRRIQELESEPERFSTLLSPKEDAPVLMPAHLGLLTQTSPIPAADPEVALYLHGRNRSTDAVTVIWRADIDPAFQKNGELVRRLLMLVPPRAAEAIELPAWAVRQWLSTETGLDALADVPAPDVDGNPLPRNQAGKRVFLWAGNDDRSTWIDARLIRPGSTIVVPAVNGGIDRHGWKPDSHQPANDIAEKAAQGMEGKRYAVRVAPGLPGVESSEKQEALAAALAAHDGGDWEDLRQAVLDATSSSEIHAALEKLGSARGKGRDKVQFELECYGQDEQGRPRGIVFFAPHGLRSEQPKSGDSTETTEDDFAGSLAGFELSLEDHSNQVADQAEDFAAAAGMHPDRVRDLRIAGLLHDTGKADARFQAWLAYGDPLGPDLTDLTRVLAKSARPLPPIARQSTGLPQFWRHEALSVRLAPLIADFNQAADKKLVLWLIGSHHGYGRPFFPHADPEDLKLRSPLPQVIGIPPELPPGQGPQSLAYEWNGLDWCSLFQQLEERYGIWELARMEAILRLADHRASADAASRTESEL
jgi:CRISPR-associated endonuclease/helicase Cas3